MIWWSDDLIIWWSDDLMIGWSDDPMIRWSDDLMIWRSDDLMIWWFDDLMIWWWGYLMIWWSDDLITWTFEKLANLFECLSWTSVRSQANLFINYYCKKVRLGSYRARLKSSIRGGGGWLFLQTMNHSNIHTRKYSKQYLKILSNPEIQSIQNLENISFI